MAGILGFLDGKSLQQIINGLSEKTGVSTDKVGTVSGSLKQMLGQDENTGTELSSKLAGDEQSSILQAIGEEAGVSPDNVSQVLQNLALMISNFSGGEGGDIGDMLTSFLNESKDGSVMDNIMGGIGNLFGGK